MKMILNSIMLLAVLLLANSCASVAQNQYRGMPGSKPTPAVVAAAEQAIPVDPGLHILINKSTQRAQLKHGSVVKIETSCGTGRGFTEEEITPTGKFHIQSKEKVHFSNQFNSVPMNWAMRIIRGVFIHGSDGYVYDRETGAGMPQSHGCVRLPPSVAQKFFDAVSVGTPVYIIGEDAESVRKSGYLELFDYTPGVIESTDNAILRIMRPNPTAADIAKAREMWLRKKLFVKRPDETTDRSKMLIGYPFMPDNTYMPFLRFQDLILTPDEKARGLRLTLDSEK